MSTESTGGGKNEAAKKGQAQQGAKGGEQQARTAGGQSQEQPEGREARETSRGLSRRAWYEPGALAIPGFGANPFSFMRGMMDDPPRQPTQARTLIPHPPTEG